MTPVDVTRIVDSEIMKSTRRKPAPSYLRSIIPIFLLLSLAVIIFTVTNRNQLFSLNSRASSQTSQAILVKPIADTIVNKSNADKNYADQKTMTIDGNPVRIGYYLFDLSSYTQTPVKNAYLQLKVQSRSLTQQTVHLVTDTSWTEKSITFENRPSEGQQIAAIGKTTNGEVVRIDVTGAVQAAVGRKLALAIKTNDNDGIVVYTRESDYPPVLSLTTDTLTGVPVTNTPSPITISPTGTRSPSPTATRTPTPTIVQTPIPTAAPIKSSGIWITKEDLSRLPTSGAAWNNLLSFAGQSGTPDLSNQDDRTDTITVAKALVYARTGNTSYADQVVAILKTLVDTHPMSESGQWDALGIVRSLGSYAIAASLIDLPTYNSGFDQTFFRPWLSLARKTVVEGGRGSVISIHEKRPNNWGTHASASRIAADLYLKDTTDLARAIQVFRGYLGNRSQYSEDTSPGFAYGELSWQPDPNNPVPLTGPGTTKNGHDMDGVRPDDQRRCGTFTWPPCKTNYTWEGLQGIIVSAELLYRAGYPSFEWDNRAILRATDWHYRTIFNDGKNFPAIGDDQWMIWVINKRYGTLYPSASGVSPGKMVGFTDWTHQ